MQPPSEQFIVGLYRRARVEWFIKGVVVLGLLLAGMIGLYVALGPQKWMPVLTFVFVAFLRGWYAAMPRRR